MKKIFVMIGGLCVLSMSSKSQNANIFLSNLSSTVKVNHSLNPWVNASITLGNSTHQWKEAWVSGSITAGSIYSGSSSVPIGVTGNGTSYGVYGFSSYIGLYGSGGTYGVYGGGTSYGVYGSSTGGYAVRGASTNNYGGYFTSSNSYGLRASTGLASKNWAGVFDGNVYAFGVYQTSDQNLKKNVSAFANATDIIDKLKPMTYEFVKEGRLAVLNLPEGKHYGLIAQDLQVVLPGLVKEVDNDLNYQKAISAQTTLSNGTDGTNNVGLQNPAEQVVPKDNLTIKAVNYTELIPILIKAFQEQNVKIKEQQAQNVDLQNQINDLKSILSKAGIGTTTSSLSGYLKQNVPNPANNNTIISYYLPDNAGKAQIWITDAKGSLIQAYNASKGNGQINIISGKLPPGVYNYTLYTNDKKIDTKQMVIAK